MEKTGSDICVPELLRPGSRKTSMESRELATRLVDILRANGTIGEEMECGWVRTRIRTSGVKAGEIEDAGVIHFDGIMKPWLDIRIDKYKRY